MGELLRIGLSNALCAAALAAVVALLVLPLRRRRPAAVHALWLLVLLKLVTPPLWTVPVQWPARDVPQAPAAGAAEWADLRDVEIIYVDEVVADAPPAPAPAPAAAPTDWARLAAGAAAVAWAAGSALCVALIVWRSVRFGRLLRLAEPAPDAVVRRVAELAGRFDAGRVPDVLFVPGAVCPMLLALGGRARLLLPRGLWERLGDDGRDTLVAHELAHLRRGDHRVRLVEVAATVLYWWNPVLWWARRELREAEEQCCDAWVVWSMPAAARHYMSAIVEAVDFVSEPRVGGGTRFARAPVPALASGMGEFRRLERRLSMIRRNQSPRRLGRAGWVAVLLAAGAALPLAPTLAQDEAPKDAAPQGGRVVAVDAVPIYTFKAASDGAGAANPPAAAGAEAAGDIPSQPAAGGAANAQSIIDADVGYIFIDGKDGEAAVRTLSADEVEQARAEVARARANLAAAEKRLEKLEAKAREGGGKKGGVSSVDIGGVPVKRSVVVSRRVPAKYDYVVTTQASAGKRPAEQDPSKRIDQLEQKLEQMNHLLQQMLEAQQHGRRDGKDKKPQDPAAEMRSY